MDNPQIDLKLVFEHLQKQAVESEIIKWALDAAFRASVIQQQAAMIKDLEDSLSARANEIRSDGHDAGSGAGANPTATEQTGGGAGGNIVDGKRRRPEVISGGG